MIDILSKDLAKLLQDNKNVIVLDVRTKEEFAQGHISGSINMPVTELDLNKIYDMCNLDDEDCENIVVVLCRSGIRSVTGINLITNNSNYDKTLNVKFYNLKHGILEWVDMGYKVVTA